MSLTISSAVGTIVVTRDGTADTDPAGGYDVDTWEPTALTITNTLAEGSLDGGDATDSRRGVVSMPMSVRCIGADRDPDDALVKAVALARVVEADDGTGWQGDPTLDIVDQRTPATSCTFFGYRTHATIVNNDVALDDGIVVVQFAPQCYRQEWTLP